MAEYSLDSPADQMETIPSCLHQRLGCVASGGETDQTMPQASVTHTPMLQKRGRDDMLNNTLTPVTPSSRKRTRFSDPPSGRENSPSGHEFRLSCPYQKAYPSSGLHCTGWAGGFENPNRLRTHLKDVHGTTHRCKTCWEKFKPQHALLKHESDGRCKSKLPAHQCWLDESQLVQLKTTTHGTYEEQWYTIAKLLIPKLNNQSISEIAKIYSPWHERSTLYRSPLTPKSLCDQNASRNTSRASPSPTPTLHGLGISLDSYTPVPAPSDESVENWHAITSNLMLLQDPDVSFGTDNSTPMHQPQPYDLEAGRPGGSLGLQASPEIDRHVAHLAVGPSYLSHESVFTGANWEPTLPSLNNEISALRDEISALKASMRVMTKRGQIIKTLAEEMMGSAQVQNSAVLTTVFDKFLKEADALVTNGTYDPDGI